MPFVFLFSLFFSFNFWFLCHFYRQLMENQINVVERGAFDDMKELERLWVSQGTGCAMKAGGRENAREQKKEMQFPNIYVHFFFSTKPCIYKHELGFPLDFLILDRLEVELSRDMKNTPYGQRQSIPLLRSRITSLCPYPPAHMSRWCKIYVFLHSSWTDWLAFVPRCFSICLPFFSGPK